jgi:hypothetical protein
MSGIPERLGKILREIGETPETACWQVRPGVYAVKHKALERVADRLNIWFDEPEFAYASPDHVIMRVTGHLDGESAWSVGEASQATSHNKYYAAMAEKRAKDRVILKLIGVSGDAYSEEEADDFKNSAPAPEVQFSKELMDHIACVREHFESVYFIKQAIQNDDDLMAAECYLELDDETKHTLRRAPSKGGVFTTAEEKYLRGPEISNAKKQILNEESAI